jgi:hypothetical protein
MNQYKADQKDWLAKVPKALPNVRGRKEPVEGWTFQKRRRKEISKGQHRVSFWIKACRHLWWSWATEDCPPQGKAVSGLRTPPSKKCEGWTGCHVDWGTNIRDDPTLGLRAHYSGRGWPELGARKDNSIPFDSRKGMCELGGVWFALLKFNGYCSTFVLFGN